MIAWVIVFNNCGDVQVAEVYLDRGDAEYACQYLNHQEGDDVYEIMSAPLYGEEFK